MYHILFDPGQGLIVPAFSYGPAWQVQQRTGIAKDWRDGDPLPDLRSWSDIAYLTWLQYSQPQNHQKLSMVASIDCTNDVTRSVVREALKKDRVKSGVPPKYVVVSVLTNHLTRVSTSSTDGQATSYHKANASSCLLCPMVSTPQCWAHRTFSGAAGL